MPEYIDLLSSDPPAPPDPKQHAQPQQSVELPSRRPSHQLNPISSDPFDSSLFNYDITFDKPAKKRRVSQEPASSLGQNTKGKEARVPTSVGDSWFAISDDDFDLPPLNAAGQKKPTKSHIEESDPIVFTSPAPGPLPKPLASRKQNKSTHDVFDFDNDDDFLNLNKPPPSSLRGRSDIEEFSDPFALPEFVDLLDKPEPKSASNSLFSSTTARLLAQIGNDKSNAAPSTRGLRGNAQSQATDIFLDDIDEPMAPQKPTKKTSKIDPADKEAKARVREATKLQKEREKELEKERKQKLKEDKAKEKQRAADIASVNKLKVNKKDSTPEMIIDMATSLEETSVGTQTIEFMKRLGVQQTFFASTIPNVVKWRRKINATYNRVARHWEPCPSFIQEEDHVLCLVPAQDFINMITSTSEAEERQSLEQHVLQIKAAYSTCKPIYLIEGLTALMRKNRNARNRAFQAEVLRQYAETAEPEPATTNTRGRSRKQKKTTDIATLVDDETIEDALLQLQVTHSCLIHHTTAPPDSAEWIKNFTEHISTVPYRRERQEANNAAFCMDVGQVKSGVDKHDTFVKMMQEVNRITAPMAYGIAGQYPCVTDLKSANKNGSLTNARIGPAASRRLYKVFTGLDPTSTDV
ncbi:uncharacterized protein N7511_008862 [Penicillium nucicola]|uniref:uncharacterized protein n=1 Tax=Penicillium nucicola TaxID=1850975 RepID=UPI002544E092|nr:uncharacterized protein N7511_008862 [Penicillium nucicola]KAJ5747166.1 hypothetical protein N7511_008862 [Penicillium nucicola]